MTKQPTTARSKTGKSKKSGKKQPDVPQSLSVAQSLERRLTLLLDTIEKTNAEAVIAKARIDAELEITTGPLIADAVALASQVHAFAEAHRSELTAGDTSKTATLGDAGLVQWHTSPAAVSIKDADAVLERLRSLELTAFIRRPPDEIDKEAMLADTERAAAVEGVTISQAEKVYVRPAGTRAYVESTLGKRGPGKWKIIWPREEESER